MASLTRLWVVVFLLGWLVLGGGIPASADAPQLMLTSPGNAQAVGSWLSVNGIKVTNSGAQALTQFTIRLELVTGSAFISPTFEFNADPYVVKSGCTVDQSVYRRAIDCTRSASIDPGATHQFSLTNAITATVGGGDKALPAVKVTVQAAGGSDTKTTSTVTHTPAMTDLSVVVSPVTGPMGGTANVTWTVTNKGPNELPRRQLKVILRAPDGTRWTGAQAEKCAPAVVPGKEYQCTTYSTLPAGNTVTETWLLKIESATVGSGTVQVEVDPYTAGTSGPEWVAVDPVSGNNTAAFGVGIRADAGGATTSETPAPPSAPPSADVSVGPTPPAADASVTPAAALATKSRGLLWTAAIGMPLLVAGGLATYVRLSRRRREEPVPD